MKPIIETHNNIKKIDYRNTALALLEVLGLTIDDLVGQAHNDHYCLLLGAKFDEETGEIIPVSDQVCNPNTTFVNAETLARIGNSAPCNCEVCEAFKHLEELDPEEWVIKSDFVEFYRANFDDSYTDLVDEIFESLAEAVEGFLGEDTDLMINSQTSKFGETHVGTASQWETLLRTAFLRHYKDLYQESLGDSWDYENSEDEYAEAEYIDEAIDNDLDTLSCATREDLLLFPRLDD